MRLSSARGYRTGFVVLLVVVLLGAVSGPATALAYPLTVGPEKFELQEVDVGAKYGCPVGTMVGVILKDSQGFVRWAFNVRDTASYLGRQRMHAPSSRYIRGQRHRRGRPQ